MASNMRTSQAGLDVIKTFEGFRPHYQKLPDGRWIIGYGHVRSDRERIDITETEAEAILRAYDLPPYERLVMDAVLAPLNQNEFDALVSLAFNIGAKAFVSSDVVAFVNSGNRLQAAHAFDAWCRARIGGREQVIDALVRRRASEKALFLKSPGVGPTAPSRLYRPLVDPVALLPAPPEEKSDPGAVDVPQPSPNTPNVTPSQTAPEAAAEAVRRRLVRIIGDDTPDRDDAALMTDGASPEEITAAISALAGETDGRGVQKSVWPSQEDLPPPPFAGNQSAPDAPDIDTGHIDDLEEVTVTQDQIDRAVAVHREMESDAHAVNWLLALPYGLLAVIGLVLAGFGVRYQFFNAGPAPAYASPIAIYLPVFLILLGGLMTIVMAYYFVRALSVDPD